MSDGYLLTAKCATEEVEVGLWRNLFPKRPIGGDFVSSCALTGFPPNADSVDILPFGWARSYGILFLPVIHVVAKSAILKDGEWILSIVTIS